MLSDHCLSVLSVCDVGLLWPNVWMYQDDTWHGGRPQPWPHYVRYDPAHAPSKEHSPPIFMYAVAKRLDGSRCQLVWKRPRPKRHCVRGGTQFPPKRGTGLHFLAHVCCGQTAGWIEMPLGTKQGRGQGDIVLNGDPFPLPQKGGTALPPLISPCIVPNGWMDQDATWYKGRPWPRPHCVRWAASSPLQNKGTAPQFSAHVYCDQTVTHLSYC